MKKLNYESLGRKVNSSEYGTVKWRFGKTGVIDRGLIVFVSGLVGVLLIFSIFRNFILAAFLDGVLLEVFSCGLSVLLLIAILFYYIRNKKIAMYRYKRFAEDNDLKIVEFLEDKKFDIYSPNDGTLGSAVRDASSTYATIETPVMIGDGEFSVYEYKLARGTLQVYQYGYIVRNWVVGVIKLENKRKNNLLIDCKKNNIFAMTMLGVVANREKLKSGNARFDRKFKLFADKNKRIEDYEFITDDFISYVANNVESMDIEIVNDSIYIYRAGRLNEKKLKEITRTMRELKRLIDK